MVVYPNPDSWDEFYPSEIFMIVTGDDSDEAILNIIKKANIGATIVLGERAQTTTYKKVAALASMADVDTSLIVLSKWFGQQG